MSYPFKICDPVHGFIRFGKFEQQVIKSLPFQRLRYIHQLGVGYLVYPGATHTRFEHSLGVMELAGRIFDALSPNLDMPEEEQSYWRLILRLAALCHDIGHLPFSHTAEASLLPQGGHEEMTLKLIRSEPLRTIWKTIAPNAEQDVIKLAITQSYESNTPLERVFAQIIIEDNFGADRIDYLLRDAQYTGVGYGHFDYHQLIDSLRVLPQHEGLTLGICASGIQSVESLWIARYMMHGRVYQLPKARIYTNHMNRFMCRHYNKGFPDTLEGYLDQSDVTILTAIQHAAKQGDEDAQILLKQIPAYKEILVEDFDPELCDRQFGDAVIIDRLELKEGCREFPVLTGDGKIVSSKKVSPFLHAIPPGGKALRLFARSDVLADVKQWLRGSAG